MAAAQIALCHNSLDYCAPQPRTTLAHTVDTSSRRSRAKRHASGTIRHQIASRSHLTHAPVRPSVGTVHGTVRALPGQRQRRKPPHPSTIAWHPPPRRRSHHRGPHAPASAHNGAARAPERPGVRPTCGEWHGRGTAGGGSVLARALGSRHACAPVRVLEGAQVDARVLLESLGGLPSAHSTASTGQKGGAKAQAGSSGSRRGNESHL